MNLRQDTEKIEERGISHIHSVEKKNTAKKNFF